MANETYNVHRWADAIVRWGGRSQAFATMREALARVRDLETLGVTGITIEDISMMPTDVVRDAWYGPYYVTGQNVDVTA